MKKILVVCALLIVFAIGTRKDEIVIPPDAIRFRVIASSNSLEDQIIKNKLSKVLSYDIEQLLRNSKNSKESKEILLKNEEIINEKINNFLQENKINYSYKLNIGKNYYPKKSYKGIEYKAGYYDSVTIELGNRSGLNWWCVIYPPLCLIDENVEDVEYTTIVRELIDKYMV